MPSTSTSTSSNFTDAPLSEHPSRNTGLKLDEMLRALKILTAGPGLVAITLTELNPHNAASDDGLLERFSAAFAGAIGSGFAATQPEAAEVPKQPDEPPRGRAEPPRKDAG